MAHGEVKHDYHLVNPSPWPFTASVGALIAAVGAVVLMKGLSAKADFFFAQGPWTLFAIGMGILVITCIGWWGDVIKESRQGDHTPVVDIGLRYGMILFIASEVMFFVAWFWAFFELAIYHGHRADWIVPTWDAATDRRVGQLAAAARRNVRPVPSAADQHAHPAALGHDGDVGAPRAANRRSQGRTQRPHPHGAAGRLFSYIQFGVEYPEAGFAFGNQGDVTNATVYGASFFMATGFHGFHVVIGTIFLFVCLLRLMAGQFTPQKHFGLEAAAWYWHFVDVVWLFLFTFVYVMPYLTMQN
jgi:cytochrome c oxidase subunit 3